MSAPYGYDRERRGGGLVGGDVGSAADPPRAGLPGPRQLDRSIHGGMELAMEQKLRLDSTDSEFGGDDGSIEPGSPVPGGAQPIPTRPGLARVQSSFTSYSSRSPASRTTSVTSLYDSLGSSAPRTNSAESVPRQSTLKTQMIPPGRTPHRVTAPEDSLPGRPRAPRSASSSSDAYYLPGAPSYPLAEPPRRPGFPGSSYSAHPLLETSYGQGGYLPVPNNPVHWAGPGYESAPYPPPPPQYYHVHSAGQAPVRPTYVLGYPAQNGYPTGLVATSDGHYVQLVAPQPYGVPVPPPQQVYQQQQPVYPQELHRHPAQYPRPYPDGPYGPPAPQRRPSGHAGSDASSPSSYQPGYHLPNLSPHILDPHYASPPSTETSPGTGPVSPFETTQTQVAYPISASRSMSSDRISLDRQRIPSGGHPPPHGGPLLSPPASVHESGPAVDPAFAFPRSALVTSVPSELLAEDAQQVGPSPMERRYATRSGYPSSHMAPHPVVGNGLVPPPPPPMGMAEMGSPSGLPLPPPPPPPSSTARHGWVPPRVSGGRARKDLPRPPTHSLHALWVGNVPSDASHAELWQFFKTRPTPAECGLVAVPGDEAADLESNGVESIHLITRSNCAFVNYITNLHLHHSIAVTNGVTLRPDDARAKPLVCRVRKAEDDSKSGVGAQRLGGLHTAFVRAQQLKMQQEQRALREKSPPPSLEISISPDKGLSDKRRKSTVSLNSSSASIGSASTTSSFLARHFERRYFILKSHDISELQKSVETGMWATQPHNEPVLQQAYKTARSVYLLFGANGAGSWFGYARMAGPIGNGGGTSSSHSTRSIGSSVGGRSATSVEHRLTYPDTTIMEENENGTSSSEVTPPVPPHVFSPSENRWLDISPTGITPTTTATATPSSAGVEVSGGSAPATLAAVPASVRRAMSQEQERVALETAERLHLPPDVADQARKSVTYDPQMREPSPPVSPEQPSIKVEDIDETLPPETPSPGEDAFVNAAEARNARLDKIETARDRASSVSTEKKSNATVRTESGSTPFAIEWIQVRTLPFARTRHIRNSFNGNREVKISRDGTEIEPAAGELVLNEFWRREPGSRTEIPMRPSSPQPIWNGSGHHHHPSSSRESETDEDRTPPGNGKAGGAGASNRASEPPLRSPAMASPPPNEGRNETI